MAQAGETVTLNVLRYTDCYRQIEHVLGGTLSDDLIRKDIVDEAGSHLVNMHPWLWLSVRQVNLELRAKITATAATWTEATKTLTKTGAFTNYTFVEGDQVEITGGTGATQRLYHLDADTVPTANAIVLTESIGAAADGLTDMTFTMNNDSVKLPDAIRNARSLSPTDAVINGVKFVTMEEIIRKRTSTFDVSTSWNYYASFNFAGDPPKPILELWPTTSSTDARAFTLSYKVGWAPGATDTEALPIPQYMNSVMIRLVRIFAQGYEEGEESGKPSLDQRLAEFEMSPLLKSAKARDGNLQPIMGVMRGGVLHGAPTGIRRLLSSEVDAPQ